MSISISFELFPPKTAQGMEKLKQTVHTLAELDPDYFSVTYGAGGSTRERTFNTVQWLQAQGWKTAPHLSCIGVSRHDLQQILQNYYQQGIQHIVALRGDLPSGTGLSELGELNHASDLVQLIRQSFGDHFYIDVAAYPEFHPQSLSPDQDLDYFKYKVDCGANSAITQYFYNPDAYWYFIEACQKKGIDIPIVPGIMPINHYANLARFSDACGAEIPRWMRKRLESYSDSESVYRFGLEVVTRLCQNLIQGGAPGLHFYTLNQAEPSLSIYRQL